MTSLPVATLPLIYDYTDYRAWMRDWFDAKAGRPSVRGFAKRAHCSASLVSAIINGKRALALDRAEVFAGLLDLDEEHQRYFFALVTLEEGFASTQRERALETVLAARRFHTATWVDDETYALMSRWYVGAITELATCEAWQDDPGWIAQALVPNISLEQATEALTVLESIGVLVRDDAGNLISSHAVWSTGHTPAREVVSVALLRLHREMLGMAVEALDTLPTEARQYSTLTFAVPDSLLPELRRRLNHYQEEVVRLVSAEASSRDRVWQLGVQLFPVSRSLVEGEGDEEGDDGDDSIGD